MNLYFILSIIVFIIGNQTAFSQSAPFSSRTADKVFGSTSPSAVKGVLSCEDLVNRNWTYPNAQVSPVCDEATTSCIRYGLIKTGMKTAKGDQYKALKASLPFALNEVKMKLMGCVQAIESTINTSNSLTDKAGYPTTRINNLSVY